MGASHKGREVIGFGVKVINVGDGLSKAMGVSPRDLNFGDRGMIVVEYVVASDEYDPAIKGDYYGPLSETIVLKGEAAFFLDDDRIAKKMEKHKSEVARAKEIEGQQSLEDDMKSDGESE